MISSLRKKYYHIIIIVVIAMLMIFPWRGGYIMLLDFFSVPEYSRATAVDIKSGAMWILLGGLKVFFGGMVMQYVIMLGALIGLGLGAYYLIREVDHDISPIGRRFGVLLMMNNPFIYDRMIEGQYNVYLGYMIILRAMYFLYRYYKNTRLSDLIGWMMLAGLGVSLLYHAIFFVGLLSTLLLLTKTSRWKRILLRIGSLIVVLLINLNWIIAGLRGETGAGQVLSHIDENQFLSFQTQQGTIGVLYNTFSLHGFRGENEGRFVVDYEINNRRSILFMILFIGFVVGYVIGVRDPRQKRLFLWMGGVALISYILALGIQGPGPLAVLTRWMYDHIPFYIGLREPQKRIGILLIFYMITGAIGRGSIYDRIVHHDKFFLWPLRIVILLLPIIYTPTMLFAFRGQLAVFHYPAGYSGAKEFLYADPFYSGLIDKSKKDCNADKCFDVLVLPWHQYMGLSFTAKITPNPWDRYFQSHDDKNLSLIVGDNMELGSIYTQSDRPASAIIEKYVHQGTGIWQSPPTESGSVSFCTDMRSLGIQAVMIMKEFERQRDKSQLDALAQSGYASLVYQNDDLYMYQLQCH